MGLSITASADNDFPYPLAITLECDAAAEMFCRGFNRYHHEHGYVGCTRKR